MTRLRRVLLLPLAIAALSGCASRQVAVAPPLPPVAMVPPAPRIALPAGAHPGMLIPAVRSDGSYPTPNQDLSPAGSIWHLRAGLNFAALACRGPEESAIIASYNAMLNGKKALLAQAERSLAAEYRAAGGAAWRHSYDDAMTRLYNYYAQAPARSALCATAERLLAEAAVVPSADFAAFAAARLPELDASFTDFYRAYDAWRTQRPSFGPVVAPLNAPIIAVASSTAMRAPPRIEVDPMIFRLP